MKKIEAARIAVEAMRDMTQEYQLSERKIYDNVLKVIQAIEGKGETIEVTEEE